LRGTGRAPAWPPRALRPPHRLGQAPPAGRAGPRERVLPSERPYHTGSGPRSGRHSACRRAGRDHHRAIPARDDQEDRGRRRRRPQGASRQRGRAPAPPEGSAAAVRRGRRCGRGANAYSPFVIARISGRLAAKNADRVMIDTSGGVGYEVVVPLGVMERLPAVGAAVSLATELVVREDGWALYGFEDEIGRRFFQRLIGVTGIGPKIAIALLSALGGRALQLLTHGCGWRRPPSGSARAVARPIVGSSPTRRRVRWTSASPATPRTRSSAMPDPCGGAPAH